MNNMSKPLDVSAVVLSAKPVSIQLEHAKVVPFVSSFQSADDLYAARLASLKEVSSEWMFSLDDDDQVSSNYRSVLEKAIAADQPLAYSNEIIRTPGGKYVISRKEPYSRKRHAQWHLMVHHLVLMKTEAAQRAAERVPSGRYFESVLFFEVARHGAAFIDEVGYIWNKRFSGLHLNPTVAEAQHNSALWFLENM